MLNKIGVATSIFAEKGFDALLSFDYVQNHQLGAIQLYMDKGLEADKERILEQQQLAKNSSTKVLCHSPYYLNKEALDGKHIAALRLIFPRGQKNYVVFHFDENTPTSEALRTIENLNSSGITVALENFYQDQTQAGLAKNLNRFRNLIAMAKQERLDLIPVIDIPRLFITPFQPFNPTFLVELLLELLENQSIILHLIDSKSPKQDRDDWVAIGSGTIPYTYIFKLLKQYNITVDTAILEYEKESLATSSISVLSELLTSLKKEPTSDKN